MRRPTLVLATVVCGALALTACGSSKKSSDNPTVSSSSPAAAAAGSSAAGSTIPLPAGLKAGDTLTVASDVSYPPVEFFDSDGTTIKGIDQDLAQAIGAKLGVTLKLTNVTFDDIIPSLVAKKYDLVMSAMTDNKKREATLDFVDYFSAGTSIVVKKGNPEGIKDFSDLCGKTATAEKGTIQISDVLEPESKKCTDAGKKAITILALPKDTDSLLAVKSGKAVADVNDSPVAAYTVKNSPSDFDAIVSTDEGLSPYGIGVLKGRDDLTKAIQAALQALIADGTYAKILATYGADAGAVTTATINGAVS